jgi:hypothetical protein
MTTQGAIKIRKKELALNYDPSDLYDPFVGLSALKVIKSVVHLIHVIGACLLRKGVRGWIRKLVIGHRCHY